jgi:hypothetical protein
MIKKNKQYLNRTPTQYSDVEKKKTLNLPDLWTKSTSQTCEHVYGFYKV